MIETGGVDSRPIIVADDAPVLTVEDLHIRHDVGVDIVDGVSLDLLPGETLGLVGESGSGKSLTALAIIGLLSNDLHASGSIQFENREISHLQDPEMQKLRGSKIAMIFQDPMTGLNPVRSVGSLLTEAVRRYRNCTRSEAKNLVVQALGDVGIPSPERRYAAYPHELSGGLRQRVMIALALVNHPKVILADEPTTALDTTIQAQIMDLLRTRIEHAGMLLITHDFGVASESCDRIAVMYCGKIVEVGTTSELLSRPRHPYTAGLLGAVPSFDRSKILHSIPGAPPSPFHRPVGCPFHPRCSRATDKCAVLVPELTMKDGHKTACWNPND